MNYRDFLLRIRKYRWSFLLLFIASFIAGGYFLAGTVLKYKSDCTFYVAAENISNPSLLWTSEEDNASLRVNAGQERIYQLAYSSEMTSFLIEKFKLYKHYNIDTTRLYYHERTVRKLSDRIVFTKLSPDLAVVSVTDRNNEIAAGMANALVKKLDHLNKNYLLNKMQSNLVFYETFLAESEKISIEQNENLQETIKKFSETLNKYKSGKDYIPISDVEFSIYQAANRIQEVTRQLLKAKSLYNNSIKSMQRANLPSVVIIKRAMPDMDSKVPLLGIYSLLFAILTLGLAILMIYLFMYYSSDFKIIFGNNPAKPG
jgi:uncharacterized protein involved in exopolysaccharide biosynthesis